MLNSSRSTNILLVLVLATGIGILAMLATVGRAGPLDPPGPPSSTDSVRMPGTPISSLPFTINQSGNYYLTRSLTGGAGTAGITINASNVTIDLGGFTLQGASTTGSGIVVPSPQSAIRVTNGNIIGWGNGIAAPSATYSHVDNVTVIGAGTVGIDLGGTSIIEDCNVSGGGGEGIRVVFTTVRDCIVNNNQGAGMVLFTRGFVHDNYLYQNNLSDPFDPVDILVAGAGNVIRDNRLYELSILEASDETRAWGNSQCIVAISNASNYEVHLPGSQLDVSPAGHTGPDPLQGVFAC